MEKYYPNKDLPPAYIFDIDGTLAKRVLRGPYDWKRAGEDVPNWDVVRVLLYLEEVKNHIIIFTGRDGSCEKETLAWLNHYHIPFSHFDIRPEGNNEQDAIIKKQMFDKIKSKYCVKGVFDDRDQVVKMWRDLGLTCFQVDYGNF